MNHIKFFNHFFWHNGLANGEFTNIIIQIYNGGIRKIVCVHKIFKLKFWQYLYIAYLRSVKQ